METMIGRFLHALVSDTPLSCGKRYPKSCSRARVQVVYPTSRGFVADNSFETRLSENNSNTNIANVTHRHEIKPDRKKVNFGQPGLHVL
jgi:hypothetical protein